MCPFHREVYHGNRYHTEFQSPMTCIDEVGHVFVNDFIIFSHNMGDILGKVLKFFKKACIYK